MGKKKKIKKMIKARIASAEGVSRTVKRTIGGKNSNVKIYRNEFIRMVNRLAMLGLTNAQMADVFGVALITFHKWIDRYPEFRNAMNEGKIMADAVIAESLYNNAKGYSHPSVKVLSNRVKEYDKDGKIVKEFTEPVLVPITKHYQPNFSAQKHWLAMRQRALWKDTDEINANINVTTIDLKDFKDEELEQMLKAGFSFKQLNGKVDDIDYEEIDD